MSELPRREFLIGCGQAAAASLVPGSLLRSEVAFGSGNTVASSEVDLHLHPEYREHTPLEPVLDKRNAAHDTFVMEKYHDGIAAILSSWSEGLLQSPLTTRSIESAFGEGLRACSLISPKVKALHSEPWLDVRQLEFPSSSSLGRREFSLELKDYLQGFSRIVTADFQVTRIELRPEDRVVTRVRYELVGTGSAFYCEQRVGTWNLTWEATNSGGYSLTHWLSEGETRSRAHSPAFEEMTQYAFGSNRSYAEQLLHGVDYWRTVLDGACGIDIYGHNGVAVADIDGDGWDDVYVCQPAGLPNRLFSNRGDGTFEDVTERSGLGILENTACAIFADFNNDGQQEVVVVRANGPLLFLNHGNGRFRQKPDAFKFANLPQGTFTGAAAADYNRDGWLDIYFCLYVYYQGAGQYKYPSPYFDANNGPPNFLMRNNRDGTFSDVTADAGLNQYNTRYSFCCGWADLNGDGWPDLYVANDFGRKNLYRNNGDGTFTDIAAQAGVEDVGAGMSVSCFDYNNDIAEDVYVANMWTAAGERITTQETFKQTSTAQVRTLLHKHAMGNSLFKNNGREHFKDVTSSAGVGLGRWAWSSDAWDFNHDGSADLYITNGMVSGPLREDMNSFFWRQVVANSTDEAKPAQAYEQGWTAINELIRADYSWSGFERNIFYLNHGDGTFSDVSGAVGLDLIEDGRAFAMADFNHDGRLELLVKNRNGPQMRLMRNSIADLPPSVCFRLQGTKSNRDAIGAVIMLETNRGRQTRTLQAGSGFLSQHSKEIFFGLGNTDGDIKASVRWPSGLVQIIAGIASNHRIYVEEGNESNRVEPFQPFSHLHIPSGTQTADILPSTAETWLLAPVSAPDFSLRASDGTAWTLSALHGQIVFLHFLSSNVSGSNEQLTQLGQLRGSVQVLVVNFERPADDRRSDFAFPILWASNDMAAVYNILYRYLFDRHRDLAFPTSLLINKQGEVVKIYRGSLQVDHVLRDIQRIPTSVADRVRKALPFEGETGTYTFARNYLSLGSIYFQRGYWNESEGAFQLALEDDQSSAEAHYGLGSCYLKQNKIAQARASFEQAVKLQATYPDTKPNAWNNLGLLAVREGREDEAIDYFQAALRQNPDYLISLTNLGNAFRQQKRWAEAQRTLEQAIAIAPEDPEVHYSLGMVFAQTDQTESALSHLRRALQLRPNYPEAMNNLGVLYLRTHRRDEAVSQFETSIRVAPEFEGAYLNLARVYLIEGDREKARATLLALLKQHPGQAQGQALLKELN